MRPIIITAVSAILAVSCTGNKNEISIIPEPQSFSVKCGSFKVAGVPVSIGEGLDARSVKAIEDFAVRLSTVTGATSEVVNAPVSKGISFVLNPALAEEEYSLEVAGSGVTVEAASFNGFLYAIQSIGQLLPVAWYGKDYAPDEQWKLPKVSIQDKPRFGYRGMSLDVCRHYFTLDEVKRYLDIMAVYKMNRLHWHLSEDQGWRIEIKKYPKLTEIGAYRNGTLVGNLHRDPAEDVYDGIRYGGYYTQEEIKEVIEYADNLGITIIPEIDLPGHMLGALTAYPELGCTGGPYEVWQRWGVSDQVLCVGKEKTFEFLEGVLEEVMDLFPSEYIHIGGDECPKTAWETCPTCQKKIRELGLKDDDKFTAEHYLQSYVTARIQKFVNDHGRKIIGWDEVLEGELAEGATVMSWRGVDGGIEAAKKGFDAIMTPNTYLYLDYFQSDQLDKEPIGIGGYLPIDTVYSYEPFKGLPEDAHNHILGVQGNLWTEYIASPEHLEYNVLPRMAAVASIQWCKEGTKDFEKFKEEVVNHQFAIYDEMDYVYSKAIIGEYGMPEGLPE